MRDHEKFSELEREIRSLPEPDYDKRFSKDTQEIIHENLLQFASTYDKKIKKRAKIWKKISVGVASVAAIVLFAILTLPGNEDHPSKTDSTNQGQQTQNHPKIDDNKTNNDKDATNQNDDKNPTKQNDQHQTEKTIFYENKEYGFTFTLPESWIGYQVVPDSWEGISSQPDQNNIIETGTILLIRHPEWTEEKPRQDIPIMIFTLDQWASLEKGDFHIGAAPIGPQKLGENNQYVFALPARYNFAFLEGYEEVENIFANNPLQATNTK